MKLFINGFGRMGRQIFRAAVSNGIKIVAINDPALTDESVRLLIKYDSVYGRFPYDVEVKNGIITVAGQKIRMYTRENLDTIDLTGVNILIESTNEPKTIDIYKQILKRNHNSDTFKIIIIKYFPGTDGTIIEGVNDLAICNLPTHSVIATSSCNAVAIAPILKSLEKFQISHVSIITLQPYLSYQKVLDNFARSGDKTSPAYFRATPNNLIPRKTSTADACLEIFPQLTGKITAHQLRLPTSCVSCAFIDIDFIDNFGPTNLKSWIKKLDPNIFSINSDKLVSLDFVGDTHSSIIDTRRLIAEGNKLKLMIWYDNEAGYAARIVNIISKLIKIQNDSNKKNNKT